MLSTYLRPFTIIFIAECMPFICALAFVLCSFGRLRSFIFFFALVSCNWFLIENMLFFRPTFGLHYQQFDVQLNSAITIYIRALCYVNSTRRGGTSNYNDIQIYISWICKGLSISISTPLYCISKFIPFALATVSNPLVVNILSIFTPKLQPINQLTICTILIYIHLANLTTCICWVINRARFVHIQRAALICIQQAYIDLEINRCTHYDSMDARIY
jgi:hypothetical protein